MADMPTNPDGTVSPAAIAAARGVSQITVRQWIIYGMKLPNRKQVRLEATRLGGRWRVRAEDLAAFETACTAGAKRPMGQDGPPVPCPSVKNAKRIKAELDEFYAICGGR